MKEEIPKPDGEEAPAIEEAEQAHLNLNDASRSEDEPDARAVEDGGDEFEDSGHDSFDDEAFERMAPAEIAGLVDALTARDDVEEHCSVENEGLTRLFNMLPAEMVMSTWHTLCIVLKNSGVTALVARAYKLYGFGQLVANAIADANPSSQ